MTNDSHAFSSGEFLRFTRQGDLHVRGVRVARLKNSLFVQREHEPVLFVLRLVLFGSDVEERARGKSFREATVRPRLADRCDSLRRAKSVQTIDPASSESSTRIMVYTREAKIGGFFEILVIAVSRFVRLSIESLEVVAVKEQQLDSLGEPAPELVVEVVAAELVR